MSSFFTVAVVVVAALVAWYIDKVINALERIAREMTAIREFLQTKFDSDNK